MPVAPSATVTLLAPLGVTGLTPGITIYNADGTVRTARTTAGITEITAPVATGAYRKQVTAPSVVGDYPVAFDNGTFAVGNLFWTAIEVATPAVDATTFASTLAAINARLAHLGVATISPIDPIDENGNTTLYRGDSYLFAFGRHLVYDIPGAIDLTLADTVTWRVADQATDLQVEMTVVDKDTAYVELTSAQTANLIPTANTPMTFEIDALLTAGETSTVKRALLAVLPDLSA